MTYQAKAGPYLSAARWMAPHFRRSRRTNLDAMRALLDAADPKAPADDRAAAATTLRAVLSGSGWVYLRDSCAMAPADIVAHAQWLVRTVTAKRGPGGRRADAATSPPWVP